jgi:antirestriction protein
MLKGFITNLGKYNEGELVGEWISFPIDEEELEDVFLRIGINDEYEEYFFTDWECPFETGFGEYESIESVNSLAEDLEREDEDLIEAIIEATGYSLRVALDHVDKAIFYQGQTLEDLAYEFVSDLCLPEIAERYFDYEAFARDLSFDGYTEVSGGVIIVD